MSTQRPLSVGMLVRIGHNFTGMGRYGLELLANLAKRDRENRYTVYNFGGRNLGFGPNFHGRMPRSIPLAGNLSASIFGRISRERVIGPEIPLHDVTYSTLHEPGGTWPVFWGAPRHIWTMHDFVLELYPELTYAHNSPLLTVISEVRREAVLSADAVVATSETCKNYAHDLFGVDRRRIFVVHRVPGHEYDPAPKPNIVHQKFGVSDYMVILGTIEPRKNHMRVLEAMARMPQLTAKLLVVGGMGWRSQEFLFLRKKLGLEERVLLPGYLASSELPAVVRNARAFLQPSLHEGSAPLLLDAMQSGVPIVASDIPEFREVAEGAAVFADPLDTGAWRHALSRVMEERSLREELAARGKELARRFTWENSAGAIVDLLGRVCGRAT